MSFEVFSRGLPPREPAEPGPGAAVYVMRNDQRRLGAIGLSAGACRMLAEIAGRDVLFVELLFDQDRAMVGMRPSLRAEGPTVHGLNAAHLVGASAMVNSWWPMRIECYEFLAYWEIPPHIPARSIPTKHENGLMTFSAFGAAGARPPGIRGGDRG